jgi:mannobiose 2-epimerase
MTRTPHHVQTTVLIALSIMVIGTMTAPAAQPDPAEYVRLADQVEAELLRELGGWYPRAVDEARGGFHATFGPDWAKRPDRTRACVLQARMTWTAAAVAIRRPEMREAYLPYVRHGVSYLADHLWDREFGGFFWELDPENGLSPSVSPEKHAYGIAFGIYATATAYAAAKDERTLQLAQDAFRWLDRHAHDAKHGGYFEALERDGTPIVAAPNADRIGTAYGRKSMNAHIHLLEAFTALHHVWPDPLVRERLLEVFTIVRDRLPQEPGYLAMFAEPDWTPLPGHVSYGHDVETVFLLAEAAAALGVPDDEATWALARRIWDNTLRHGYDTEHGGIFYEGPPRGPAEKRQKVWWAEAEALQSLCLMHARFVRREPRYWDAFVGTWAFVTRHQVDAQHGGWHGHVSPDGSKVLSADKGDNWKEPYHTCRALMNCADMLRDLGKGVTPATGNQQR